MFDYDYPLNVNDLLYRARDLFPKKELVTRYPEGIHRYTYEDFYKRVCQLAHALDKLGLKKGERVGSFAWNTHRHMELYFALPCTERVLHTVNIRIPDEHVAHVISVAEDRYLFVDEDLIPIIERVQDRLETVKGYIVMSHSGKVPDTTLKPVYSYEELIAGKEEDYPFPEFIDEKATALMCFTSATTGFPKGVEYTHRGIVLHSLVSSLPDAFNMHEKRVMMTVVPMFHVLSWGYPFACTMVGAKQVFPGPHPTPKDLVELIEREKVNYAAGVPTIWLAVLNEIEAGGHDVGSLKEILSGGSAPPRALIEAYERHGITLTHAYGMTEAYPLVLVSRLKSYLEDLPDDDKYRLRAKQGLLLPCLRCKVVGESGQEVAHDGKEFGELLLRGPWIVRGYYRDEERTQETFGDGWYHTGDVVSIDEEGYIQVADRTKDLIKSGGEWISSVQLENAIMAHPAVKEAAVIAARHPKWDERPLACVVLKEGEKEESKKEEILESLSNRFPKWWLPDEILFVDEIPKTSVGKFDKKVLRKKFGDYYTGK